MNLAVTLVVGLLVALTTAQKNPNFASSRSTIVHLFEWKWDDIAAECENFLQQKGFGGVQTSPPNENMVINNPNRPWWERYQPVSYQLITRSGDESAFASMVKRCNAVGVRIYIDLVVNHMAAFSGTGTGGSACDPPSRSFPAVPYSTEDFHAKCPMNNDRDPTILRNCELNELPDLDQSIDHVRDKIVEFMNHLVDLGVGGFRVDAAKLMWPDDLEQIYNKIKDLNTEHGFRAGEKPFIYQEVIDMGGDVVSATDYNFASVLEFKSGTYLGDAFQGNKALSDLQNWGPEWGLLDSTDAVVFIDNHDNQRHGTSSILTYKNPRPYKMAIAFMQAHPYGTTRIMSSFDFTDTDIGPPQDSNGNIIGPGFNPDNTCTNGWVCEHRWREIYKTVEFRNTVQGTEITNWWANGSNQIAFGRGDKGFIAFSTSGDLDQSLSTSLPAGTYCDIMSGEVENGKCTGKNITVDSSGKAHIQIAELDLDGVVAIHVNAKI